VVSSLDDEMPSALKMRTPGGFETSGTSHPVMQRHIPKERRCEF
jgi:hypothetical protein